MKIAFGTDHAGFRYKEKVKQLVTSLGHEVKDFGTFSEDNVPFARPDGTAAAEYRVFCTNRAGQGGDLNRNGRCGETFAFLWDGLQDGVVWRDSDADGSFADEVGMHSFKTAFEVGEYGHDDPSTAIRESVPAC